jgi:hypothetical protein
MTADLELNAGLMFACTVRFHRKQLQPSEASTRPKEPRLRSKGGMKPQSGNDQKKVAFGK